MQDESGKENCQHTGPTARFMVKLVSSCVLASGCNPTVTHCILAYPTLPHPIFFHPHLTQPIPVTQTRMCQRHGYVNDTDLSTTQIYQRHRDVNDTEMSMTRKCQRQGMSTWFRCAVKKEHHSCPALSRAGGQRPPM